MESSSKDKIEKIIFKLLYELKSIKSTNILVEKILEKDELKNEKKIQFNQKDGWKMLF